MKRAMGVLAGLAFLTVLSVLIVVCLVRGFAAVKRAGHEKKWWDAPASLDSWDPQERIEAAEAAANKYGGKP